MLLRKSKLGNAISRTFWHRIEEFGQQKCCKNCFIEYKFFNSMSESAGNGISELRLSEEHAPDPSVLSPPKKSCIFWSVCAFFGQFAKKRAFFCQFV